MRPRDTGMMTKRRWHRHPLFLAAAGLYILLLIVSHFIRGQQPDPWTLPHRMRAITVDRYDGHRQPDFPVRMAYTDTRPSAGSDIPIIVLVHGSPAPASAVFSDVIQQLSTHGRVLAPDLPGFGYSTRNIADYGFKAHADYLLQFIDRLAAGPVHLVAYSMGGGAAIRLAVEQDARVASLTLISSLGVQELELLGNYHLNHMLHATQLLFFWTLQELTPHMGYLDRFFLNRAYARNFFDADQRPLRRLLQRVRQPTLILHGRRDSFVLPAAATEHARLVPQSELVMTDGGHLMVFNRTRETISAVGAFLSKVFSGDGVSRQGADAGRARRAADPQAAVKMAPARGNLLITYFVLIALATFISEDLACIGAGLLAARGVIGIGAAIFASFTGIVIGDLLLFAAGRYIGRAAVSRIPLRWFVKPEDLEVATGWFNARGPRIIIASRFLPGSRLPTYVTAGILGTQPLVFLLYFSLAALLWTPALVGLAALLGHQLLDYYELFSRYAVWMVIGLVAILYLITHIMIPLFSFRGRRLLLAKYRKWRHWAFWPVCISCLPVAAYICWMGLRRGNLTLFTATNPGLVTGRSKSAILDQLAASNAVADYLQVPRNSPLKDQLKRIEAFMQGRGSGFPVILKPDEGKRGMGAELVHHPGQVQSFLERAVYDTIVQQYIPGREFGVLYYRYPNERHGTIFSITENQSIVLQGDGRSTLETLILKDDRAVNLAPVHFRTHRSQLYRTPALGERIELASGDAHARGTILRDAGHLATEALTRAVDDISKHFKGFYFGYYDFRAASVKAFRQGRDLSVIELNGVSFEAGHVCQTSRGLLHAWGLLMRQWKIAIEIGKINHDHGVPVLSIFKFLKRAYRKLARAHR